MGGDREKTKASVDEDAMQTLRWTYLEPLRDAVSALAPGKNSRIEKLLNALKSENDKKEIETLFSDANNILLKKTIIKKAHDSISNHLTKKLGKSLSQHTSLQSSEYQFDKIIRTLKLVLKGNKPQIDETSGEKKFEYFGLDTNGLGYNNLIYIAVVLAELESSIKANYRLLLVEEPESHLHPQLQTKLADYLSKLATPSVSGIVSPVSDETAEDIEVTPPSPVQVIVTSHSPVISSHVRPDQLRILHKTTENKHKVGDISSEKITPEDLAAIQRLLDVTNGAMCFARGIIFVEGVTEELLFPVLAQKLNISLDDYGVSIIPVHGVDFTTLLTFFGQDEFEIDIPVAVVSDKDPKKKLPDGNKWDGSAKTKDGVMPERDTDDKIIPCDRIINLREKIKTKPNIKLFPSSITLEYTLAYCSKNNIELMILAWKKFYIKNPNFSADKIRQLKIDIENSRQRGLFAWREICLSQADVSKAEFAHQLAYMISNGKEFDVPAYIEKAIKHACGLK